MTRSELISSYPEDLVLWDVMQEHLEEAGFLWSLWERSFLAPDFSLDDVVAGEEGRLVAHLEGLVVGGAPVVRGLLLPELKEGADPELAFAAGLALMIGDEAHGRSVVAALAMADKERRRALRRALELSKLSDPTATIAPLFSHPEPSVRATALTVLAHHGVDRGATLARYLEDADPAVRAAALKVARAPSGRSLRSMLERRLLDQDSRVRGAALETCLMLGLAGTFERCKENCEEAMDAPALLQLALLGTAADLELLGGALAHADHRADALWALGFSGRRRAVDLCLDHLDGPPDDARLAAEAICAITGLDLSSSNLALAPDSDDKDEPLPLEEDDLDADLVAAPVDALPLPNPGAVRAWWETNRGRFLPTQRYLGGAPVSVARYRAGLVAGPMRRRHVLALELAIRTGGVFALQTSSWGQAQMTWLRGAQWPEPSRLTAPVQELLRW